MPASTAHVEKPLTSTERTECHIYIRTDIAADDLTRVAFSKLIITIVCCGFRYVSGNKLSNRTTAVVRLLY